MKQNIFYIVLLTSILFSISCKKVENFDDKVGGCYDVDSPIHDGTIDYDNGTCQYAYIDKYELTKHPAQDPASGGQDWDVLAVGDFTRPDIILTINTQLTGELLFKSATFEDVAPTEAPLWMAPSSQQLYNRMYEWTIYDDDVSGSEFMAYGRFNPIKEGNNGLIVSSDTNSLGEVTELKIYYTVK